MENKDAIILVYDITNVESFNSLNSFHELAKTVNPDAFVMIIGNKIDLEV